MTNGEIITAGHKAGHDFYWYHVQVYREIERLASLGETSTNAVAVAGNVKSHSGDVTRWCREMIDAGILRKSDPAWEYDALWVGLA